MSRERQNLHAVQLYNVMLPHVLSVCARACVFVETKTGGSRLKSINQTGDFSFKDVSKSLRD